MGRSRQAAREQIAVVGERFSLAFQAGFDRRTRAQTLGLRQTEFARRNDYLLAEREGLHPAEDEFDADSYQFCCLRDGDVVAACRYTPARGGAWEASRHCSLPAALYVDSEQRLQISRVVVHHDLRRMLITEVMLCMACRWLLENTRFTQYFALCLPQLARYYEHFGAQVLSGGDRVLVSRKSARYQFVQGQLRRSNEMITSYLQTQHPGAWQLPDDLSTELHQPRTSAEASMTDFLSECERQVTASWAALKDGSFWQHVMEHGFDLELYTGLMTEIYHYTRENSQNQALAALSVHSDRLSLLRFCLHHAFEEAGHDLMALNDLRSVGVDTDAVKKSAPLPETQAFIAYLYRAASTKDATARLGYSYWAESCYPHIAEVLGAMKSSLDLEDADMTFFVAHSKIDEGHFEEVQRIALEHCTSSELQAEFLGVLRTSLHLQGQMLDGIIRAYRSSRELVAGTMA